MLTRYFPLLITSLIAASPLWAVPKLRLTTTSIGPITIAQGSVAAAQQVEAFGLSETDANNETSLLRLTFQASAPWVSASAAAARNCSRRDGQCLPINITFATQQLAAGRYSATISVRDPNAIDAPQDILVILSVGSVVPNSIDLYVPPSGASTETIFYTNSRITGTTTTQSGGQWLSLAFAAQGSFEFVQPYRVRATRLDSTPEGTYRGSIAVRESRFAADNKDVAVTFRVTSQPIADPAQGAVRIRMAQNTIVRTQDIRIGNRGLGTLTVSGVSQTVAAAGTWLKSEQIAGSNIVRLTLDAKDLNPGVYTASVAVQSNAVNSPLTIPVEFEVAAQGPPVIRLDGVMDNATFTEGDEIAQGGVVAAFGEQFSFEDLKVAGAVPLPTELGGARIFVNDQPAPLYFTSYGQAVFQVPYDARVGPGVVRVDRGSTRGNNASVVIRASRPKLIRLNLRAAGLPIPESRDFFAVAVNASDNTFSLPASFGVPGSRPSRKGEAVILYGYGFGQTSPPVTAGAAVPADPLPIVPSETRSVIFGALALNTGVPTDALYVGLAPGFVGLYQINVVIPEDSPTGDVPVRVQLDTVASEYGLIAIE